MNQTIVEALNSYANPAKIADYKRFFKTGRGEYGEGDCFLGINVPNTRRVVKCYYKTMSFDEIEAFLYSPYHEHRLFALLVLVALFQAKDLDYQTPIYNFYLKHIHQINNWDLVDSSASYIVGSYLLQRNRSILHQWATSSHLWTRRIAIVSTFAFIKAGDFEDSLALSDQLLHDSHDLIHKAVGWVLRTIGDHDINRLIAYLNPRYKQMPRTMLRYAIEKFDEPLRQSYLKGLV